LSDFGLDSAAGFDSAFAAGFDSLAAGVDEADAELPESLELLALSLFGAEPDERCAFLP
jgi:hypothetical protein